MKKLLSAATAVAIFAVASQASATTYVVDNTGDTSKPFYVDTTTSTPSLINAAINGITPVTVGVFQDVFEFLLPNTAALWNGTGAVTSSNKFALDFTSGFLTIYTDAAGTTVDRVVNGFVQDIMGTSTISFGVSALNIPADVLVKVTVNGNQYSNGNYGGVLRADAVPAVPEPATWAMLLTGFGAVGYAMRRRRAPQAVKVSFG